MFVEKNAVIVSAKIMMSGRGLLHGWLQFDYGFDEQGLDCRIVYTPGSPEHRGGDCAGLFILRVMEVAGVSSWDHVVGRPVRVRKTPLGVVEIGHIIKDDWFNPSKVLKEALVP
jgi:hypothetical protein